MSPSDRSSPGASGPFFIVMNARSGARDADSREAAIRGVLSSAGRPYRVFRVTQSRELQGVARQAVQLAVQQGGVVVAAGGDGTINTVVQEVIGAGCPMGVLPQGTFNYFGRAHGIPLDTVEAARILLEGDLRRVQVGLVNERAFLVNASLGLYPQVFEKREAHKEIFGRSRLVAFLSALATLVSPPPRLVLSLEAQGSKEVMGISTLFIDNNPIQLQEVGLPEEHAVKMGELAAIVVRAAGVGDMFRVLAMAAVGRLAQAEGVRSFSFTKLTVQPLRRRRVKVAVDGEVVRMVAPLVFRAAPQTLPLLVPAGRAAREPAP